MGKFQPLPIVGGCYADDARPYSSQDCVNYLPVKAEASGTRSEGKLTCVPGLVPFCGTQLAPVRGAHNCEGRYFVVAGTTLYQISTLGARTVLGTIPGTGRVCFDHNQITGGNEVVVVNGSQGFVYNTKTGVFAQITDQDFPGSAIARYLGQYILGIKPDRTGWFHSDLATATTWLSTDTYEAESSPDLLVDIQVSQGRALIMGERTIEEWVNEPTENAAFQRGSVIERGAASPFANVIMDNTLIWLGDDGIVYRLDGYTPRRISTFPIEQALSRNTLANAFAFAWEDRGHKVFYLTLPDGHTWGYDIASGLWHRRESYRLDRWIANTLTHWNGAWYAGDYDSGVIYRLDWDVMAEGCNKLVRSRTLACLHDNENRLTVDAVALTVDVGTEPSAATHGPPTVTGALPDGFVGDTVSYQYTLTGSYPGEYVTATATGLPTGLSMSSTGLVSGTLTAAGTFTPIITATGTCGDTATLTDSVVISAAGTGAWFLVAGGQSYVYSADGLDWTGAAIDPYPALGTPSALDHAFGAGSNIVFIQTAHVGIRSANLGGTWADVTGISGMGNINASAYVNGVYHLAANGSYYGHSTDGLAYAASVISGSVNLYTIAGRVGLLYALGAFTDGFYSLDNGASWTATTRIDAATPDVRALACSSTAFVCGTDNGVGVGKLYRSVAVDTWVEITNPFGTVAPACLAMGGGYFVAGAFDGSIAWSHDDGVTWTKLTTGLGARARSVRFLRNRFVMVGDSGKIKTATDPTVTWTDAGTTAFGTSTLFDVAAITG